MPKRFGLFTTKNIGYLGVDIKPTMVTFVQLRFNEKEKMPQLMTYGIAPRQQDETQDITKTLRTLLKKANVTTTKTVIGLSNNLTILTIELPYDIPQKRLDNEVRKKAQVLIGDPIKQMAIGWTIIEHEIVKNENQKINVAQSAWKILLVLSPQHYLTTLQSIANNTKLALVASGIKPLAIARAIKHQLPGSATILNIEKEHFEIITTKKSVVRNIITNTNHIDFEIQLQNKILRKPVILAGAYAKQYLEEYPQTKIPRDHIEFANPWKRILVPDGLKETLIDIGPTLAAACGFALREILRKQEKEKA